MGSILTNLRISSHSSSECHSSEKFFPVGGLGYIPLGLEYSLRERISVRLSHSQVKNAG